MRLPSLIDHKIINNTRHSLNIDKERKQRYEKTVQPMFIITYVFKDI